MKTNVTIELTHEEFQIIFTLLRNNIGPNVRRLHSGDVSALAHRFEVIKVQDELRQRERGRAQQT